ncbi:MAG: hypothetical protein WD512_15205 [Candidatus Paceibacterota bacterium]
MSTCANCNCSKTMMEKYRNISRYRSSTDVTSSWHQDASKLDYRIFKRILFGSVVAGASLWTIAHNSPYKDESGIRDDIISGSFLGAAAGSAFWIIYPYPAAITSIIGTCVFLNIGPKYIKDYFDANRKVSTYTEYCLEDAKKKKSTQSDVKGRLS